MRGLIYQHAALYNSMMRFIYGPDFIRRYTLVSENISEGWSVLDLCCGDCFILRFLPKGTDYNGRDFNEVFIKGAVKKGIKAEVRDLKKGIGEPNKFDCVMIMGSLHQFAPDHDKFISDMKAMAIKRVIISEPVKNIVTSHNKLVAILARILSNPGDETVSSIKRFSLDEVQAIFKKHKAVKIIDAGKDMIGVFDI